MPQGLGVRVPPGAPKGNEMIDWIQKKVIEAPRANGEKPTRQMRIGRWVALGMIYIPGAIGVIILLIA